MQGSAGWQRTRGDNQAATRKAGPASGPRRDRPERTSAGGAMSGGAGRGERRRRAARARSASSASTTLATLGSFTSTHAAQLPPAKEFQQCGRVAACALSFRPSRAWANRTTLAATADDSG